MPKPTNHVTEAVQVGTLTDKKPSSILSPAVKKNIFNQLKKIPDDALLNALKVALKNQNKFPKPLGNDVDDFYILINKRKTNQKVLHPLQTALSEFITSDGLTLFKKMLQAEFVEADWPSDFLCTLTSALNIKLNVEPHVQVAIKEGKVFWRIMKGEREMFNKFKKEGQEIDFASLDTWNMTWPQFRLFKDSGKRSGNVEITLERFKRCFEISLHSQAEMVWNELKVIGILNNNNKLSDAWRAISGQNITLDSITGTTPNSILTAEKLKECLKALAGTKKTGIISKNNFKNWWPAELQLKAGMIWDKLKAAGHINNQNKLKSFVFSYKEIVGGINLNYKNIVDSLYEVANNEQYKESITEIPNAFIFRAERTIKSWSDTGRVTYSEATDDQYCTKIWDVSIYDNLGSHRNSENETAENNNQKLNYDHIPSADSLKTKAQSIIKVKEKQIKTLDDDIAAREQDLDELQQDDEEDQQDAIDELNDKIEDLKRRKTNIESRKDEIASEMKNHGKIWWTIAIPENLHKQGETFMQSSKDQAKTADGHFLKDVTDYLNKLEKRPEDFSLKQDDYLKALGAFRYLYKKNITKTNNIAGHYNIGTVPQTLFNTKNKQDIDKLLRERTIKFLQEREGFQFNTDKKDGVTHKPTAMGG